MTLTTSRDSTELSPQERKAKARDLYRHSMADGAPLSGKALGARFSMSERWGRKIIAEARGTQDNNRGNADQPNGTATVNPAHPNGLEDVPVAETASSGTTAVTPSTLTGPGTPQRGQATCRVGSTR